MKLEKLLLRNFRCFGGKGIEIEFESGLTAFVGGNGSGKTAVFQALSRLFGITKTQKTIRREDFHVPPDQGELKSEEKLSIEVVFSFPELENSDPKTTNDAVPEFFHQMAISYPGGKPKARMILKASWVEDGTPEGSIDEEIRWVNTLGEDYKWEDCVRVQASERSSIQFIYVPAIRDGVGKASDLLKSRLWKAAKWSETFRNDSSDSAQKIQELFENEGPACFIRRRLAKRWKQVHEAGTDTTPILRLVENRFEELVDKAEFSFFPDEEGKERSLKDLSDGQRSLFHIALTTAILETEKDIFEQTRDDCFFEQGKLRFTVLTFLGIEEPENSLSPFFLSRIISQAREISDLSSAQVALSSHSPSIMARIEPEEVRYFRLDSKERCAYIHRLNLPEDNEKASKYVRLGIKAFPELYFAHFVILGEGDSERFLIPRIASAMGVQLDQSFVPVVPLGGRYVSYFWKLLNDLKIPHATLLDLDLGRKHGGVAIISDIIRKLKEFGKDLNNNSFIKEGKIDLEKVNALDDSKLLKEGENNNWLKALREEEIYFSFPLDIDFAMTRAFPKYYKRPGERGKGPRTGNEEIQNKKRAVLKTRGNTDLYPEDFNSDFNWYNYLFLNRSKPEAHIFAFSEIDEGELMEKSPPELKKLIEKVREKLSFKEENE